MDFVPGASVFAGLVAALVMTALLYSTRSLMPSQMPMNMLLILGTMITRRTRFALIAGWFVHLTIGLFFAIVHTAVYATIGLDSGLAWWGLLSGFLQWLIAGAAMGAMDAFHPLIRSGDMSPPGYFAKNLPLINMAGFLTVHLVFGLIVGGLYEAFV